MDYKDGNEGLPRSIFFVPSAKAQSDFEWLISSEYTKNSFNEPFLRELIARRHEADRRMSAMLTINLFLCLILFSTYRDIPISLSFVSNFDFSEYRDVIVFVSATISLVLCFELSTFLLSERMIKSLASRFGPVVGKSLFLVPFLGSFEVADLLLTPEAGYQPGRRLRTFRKIWRLVFFAFYLFVVTLYYILHGYVLAEIWVSFQSGAWLSVSLFVMAFVVDLLAFSFFIASYVLPNEFILPTRESHAVDDAEAEFLTHQNE